MKFSTVAISFIASAHAFTPMNGPSTKKSKTQSSITSDVDSGKPIYDPLGLYPKDAPERKSGLIQPLESSNPKSDSTVKDPLNLYQDRSEVNDSAVMSASLPFLKRPEMLDGSLPGDRGFDPFNFSSDKNSLQWMRNAEVKHARLAMLVSSLMV